MDYKTAGVDIESGKTFVNSIRNIVKTTYVDGVIGGLGGFSGMMEIPNGYDKPVLVSGADGVGTKIHIAKTISYGGDETPYRGIGTDLVAMCVNDVITCGAKPLYFLDYVSTTQIRQSLLYQLILGIVDGCISSGCALIGGETAEHPVKFGMVSDEDLSGFCTGIIEKNEIIDGSLINDGDKIIGLASSGIHSNGFSLINELLFRHKLFISNTPELLIPTRIYASVVSKLIEEVPVLGMSHITGGGIPENLPRCLPEGLTANVDYDSWEVPYIFNKIMIDGEISLDEMRRVYNMGIGYCIIVPEECVDISMEIIKFMNIDSWVIGEVTK